MNPCPCGYYDGRSDRCRRTRGMYRVLRVARTVADLAESETVRTEHLSEAISYRNSFGGGASR